MTDPADANIDRAVQRLADLARAYLNDAKTPYGVDFDIGIVGCVFELTRPDGWYGVGATCSDDRDWVRAGLFREAIRIADSDDPDDFTLPLPPVDAE